MSKLGGYKIVNLRGTPFTSGTEATVKGIYDVIESTNKSILVSGLVLDGIEYDDFYALFTVSGTSYYAYIPIIDGTYSITIVVADDDGVTVTLNEPEV